MLGPVWLNNLQGGVSPVAIEKQALDLSAAYNERRRYGIWVNTRRLKILFERARVADKVAISRRGHSLLLVPKK